MRWTKASEARRFALGPEAFKFPPQKAQSGSTAEIGIFKYFDILDRNHTGSILLYF